MEKSVFSNEVSRDGSTTLHGRLHANTKKKRSIFSVGFLFHFDIFFGLVFVCFDFSFCVSLLFFLRERTNSWIGRNDWRTVEGEEKHDQNILYENNF